MHALPVPLVQKQPIPIPPPSGLEVMPWQKMMAQNTNLKTM